MTSWINILGLVAAGCTTISISMQTIKTVKTRKTMDISMGMCWLLTIGLTLWLIYGIFKGDTPLIFANSISVGCSAVTLVYKMKYG